ncbi:MAG: hypothetical protein KKA60_11875 [Proteobacteria bacterium]|nr:hypothetical protein [Pseudomonadota bacterium]
MLLASEILVEEAALPNPDFIGLCLGDYGAGVITAYKEPARADPILNPCSEVAMTLGRARDVFHARTEPEAITSLAMCLDSCSRLRRCELRGAR